MRNLKVLVVAAVMLSVSAGAWAQFWGPDSFYSQSTVMEEYLRRIPGDGSTGFQTPLEVWVDMRATTHAWLADPGFSNFAENLAIVLADPEVTPTLLKGDVDRALDLDDGDPGNDRWYILQSLRTYPNQYARLVQDLTATFNCSEAQARSLIDRALEDAEDEVFDLTESEDYLALLGEVVGVARAGVDDLESAVRRSMGGFSPESSPIILSRNLMKNRLRGASPVSGSAWGVRTWLQDSEFGEDSDGMSLGGHPYVQKVDGKATWSFGTPLLYSNFEDVEDDDQWAGGLDGSVEYDLGSGFFVGAHGAAMENYAEILEDNQFLSLSAGPFAGKSFAITEKCVATAMVMTEGISTEHEDDTWYVSGGTGVSYRITERVTGNIFGMYYRTMDTYTDDDDADFFDVGASVETAVGEASAVSFGISSIRGSEDYRAWTFDLGFIRNF